MDGDLWHCRGVRDQDHPQEKEMQKAKLLSEEALQKAMKRRNTKGNEEEEWYTHLNAEFQRIARRDKKAFLSNQCKEIEENNSHDPADVDNLISCSSAFCKTCLNIWKFKVHILLKPGLENFEHYFTSLWDECNCVVVWAFFGIVFLWDWNENWPFPVLWPLLSFPNFLAYCVQHFHSIIFRVWNRIVM